MAFDLPTSSAKNPRCSSDDEVSVSSIELIEGQSKKVALVCGGWSLLVDDFPEEFYVINLKSFEQDGKEIYANVETANCSLPNPFRPRLGVVHSLYDLPQKFEDLPLGHYQIVEDIDDDMRLVDAESAGLFGSIYQLKTVKILRGQKKLNEYSNKREGVAPSRANNSRAGRVTNVCIGCGVDISNKKSYCKKQVCKKCFNDGWRVFPLRYEYQMKQQAHVTEFIDRVFCPLDKEWYDLFEAGKKTWEIRSVKSPVGRSALKHGVGALIELRLGYGGRSIWGRIVDLERLSSASAIPSTILSEAACSCSDIIDLYGNAELVAIKVGIVHRWEDVEAEFSSGGDEDAKSWTGRRT